MKNYEHFKINPKMIAFRMAYNFFGNNVIRKHIDFLINNRFNSGIWSSIDSSFLRYNDGKIAKTIEEYWNMDKNFIRMTIKEYNYMFCYPTKHITKENLRLFLNHMESIFNFIIDNGSNRWKED